MNKEQTKGEMVGKRGKRKGSSGRPPRPQDEHSFPPGPECDTHALQLPWRNARACMHRGSPGSAKSLLGNRRATEPAPHTGLGGATGGTNRLGPSATLSGLGRDALPVRRGRMGATLAI